MWGNIGSKGWYRREWKIKKRINAINKRNRVRSYKL